jgi:peptidyl-prolyl cis-trans isomerase SurA
MESLSRYPAIYNGVYVSGREFDPGFAFMMIPRSLRIPSVFVVVTALAAGSCHAQSRASAPASPYGGTPVEEIVARVNDQIISTSDYDRATKELDQEMRQRGSSMQEISEAHKDLLRNLIDQQLWLSKGKELGISGETELVNRLNEIRKQYNLASLEDLEKAAQEQGVSYEDFKANIRNGIITQEVMRDEVGRKINITPGEAQRFFEEHKQDYAQQESVHLSEILVPTGAGDAGSDDPKVIADAQAQADKIESELNGGADFSQLARTYSKGSTAAEGGDLGVYKRGALAKVLEDQVFALNAGQSTKPIRTKQGFIILKVVDHTPGGVPEFKDVEQDVEQNYYMSKMEPAIREYLTKMRDDSYIEIKPGFVDTGASPNYNKSVFAISYSAYTPPNAKKKKKVERTRFRETTHTFRQKTPPASLSETAGAATAAAATTTATAQKTSKAATTTATLKPGKKEKIRYGKAPQETLPNTPSLQTEDAGATPTQTAASGPEPANPLETTEEPTKKTRYSDRAREPKQPKKKEVEEKKRDAMTPAAASAAEVADRQTQSAPLGLGGDTASKKKKTETTSGEKTRMSDKARKPAEPQATPVPTPIPPVAGAPAPAPTPAAPQPQQ